MELRKAEKRHKLTTNDYAQLVAFRHAMRGFMRFSEEAAADTGLTSQHYQAMLILRAWREDQPLMINDLAQQLMIKHNSAVGLVDRLAEVGLVVRERSTSDRRKVELRLTPRGRTVLAGLAAKHRRELQQMGPLLERFFAGLSRMKGPARR